MSARLLMFASAHQQTFRNANPVSALGQRRTNHRDSKSTFVRFDPKADKRGCGQKVRFVPKAIICATIVARVRFEKSVCAIGIRRQNN
jgi:hypothetical protein